MIQRRRFDCSTTEGYVPLREDVVARLNKKFSIDADVNNTIITSGGRQGIELACKALCNEGDAVICENPSFIRRSERFPLLRCRRRLVFELEIDGIDPEKLDRLISETPDAKMLYLIPTFQNPAGITTSTRKAPCDLRGCKKAQYHNIRGRPLRRAPLLG